MYQSSCVYMCVSVPVRSSFPSLVIRSYRSLTVAYEVTYDTVHGFYI